MPKFIGRQYELNRLKKLTNHKHASMVLVKGRRRIGKSRLLEVFGEQFDHCYIFSGLPPEEGIGAAEQRTEFARQLEAAFDLRGLKSDEWGDLLWNLTVQTQKKKTLIILDEISWMAEGDVTFLPKLKVAWDTGLKKNPNLVLALCSSISMWVERNIISSTGFLGRNSLTINLRELSLKESIAFLNSGANISAKEKLILLAVTGGVPRYLEECHPNEPAIHNIRDLCFTPEGVLFNEFETLFSDLFQKDNEIYKKIANTLINGQREAKAIYNAIRLEGSGKDYYYLENLEKAGFISRDYTWQLKNGKMSKLSQYRLSDNYTRFYLKYILPNQHKIKEGDFKNMSLASLPGWSTIMGLQLENLVLNNRDLIKTALELNPDDIVCSNPYFQRKTLRQAGCQIDYMIQTRFDTLYVCEIKFSKKPLGIEVIEQMTEKITRLNAPKGFSIRPVLIHCSDVTETVEEAHFFAKIINVMDFFKE